MMEESAARAMACTWRNEETGEVVGSTWGGTCCWFPRKPWAIKISRDGLEHVIRCGDCPGCLEFDRRRLSDRLRAKYYPRGVERRFDAGAHHAVPSRETLGLTAPLYLARIYAPLEQHSRLSHSLHRRRGIELEPGYFRLGATSFAVLSRSRGPLAAILRAVRLEHRIESVQLKRGRRAWQPLTAGVLVAREVYGEQVKRWYARGLPKLEREPWQVEKRAMQKPWRRAGGARARTKSSVVLVPPELWRLPRGARRNLRAALSGARDPEGVRRVMALVTQALGEKNRPYNSQKPAVGRLTADQVREWYTRMAARKVAGSHPSSESGSSSPNLLGRGYGSSVHAEGPAPPVPLSDAELLELGPSGKPKWVERELTKSKSIRQLEAERVTEFQRALKDWNPALGKTLKGSK
jgi:hypothetical protein